MANNFSQSSDEDDISAGNTALLADYNLIGNPTGHILFGDGANTNLVGTLSSPLDPLLGPLDDNDGPTPTHALLRGSPAIDAGHPAISVSPLNDQRGFNRLTGVIDIGAVEAPTTAITGGPYSVDEDQSLTLTGAGISRQSGTLSFAWDLDDDGQYDDATGTSPSFTWDDLTEAGGLNLADGDHTIGLQVTDQFDSTTILATQTTILTINFFDLEVWRRQFFTTGELDNSKLEENVWGDFANPDGDSLPNLTEFFMGLNPLQRDDEGLFETTLTTNTIAFTYLRAINFPGVIGTVEWSTDLVNWFTTNITEQVIGAQGDSEIVEATVTFSGETSIFVRLRVEFD